MCDFCRYNCVTKLVTVMKQNFLLPTLVFLFVALFALPANAQRPGGTRGSSPDESDAIDFYPSSYQYAQQHESPH